MATETTAKDESRFVQMGYAEKTVRSFYIYISKACYEWVKENTDSCFTASNGISIRCKNSYTPGFENGNDDTLYLDTSFIDVTTELPYGWEKLAKKQERVAQALRELHDTFAAAPRAKKGTRDDLVWV